jgi:hypothetical protein
VGLSQQDLTSVVQRYVAKLQGLNLQVKKSEVLKVNVQEIHTENWWTSRKPDYRWHLCAGKDLKSMCALSESWQNEPSPNGTTT